jgi:hypothetical protein
MFKFLVEYSKVENYISRSNSMVEYVKRSPFANPNISITDLELASFKLEMNLSTH